MRWVAMAGFREAVSALTFLGVGLGACSRSTHTDGAVTTAAPTGSADTLPEASMAAVGVIYVAGSEPATLLTLRPDTGTALQLHGDLTGELRRLSGAVVEVRGSPVTMGSGEGIVVNGYTLLEVDGRRPRVGVLVTSRGALWLGGQDSLALADPQERLAPLAGAKVWVIADTTTSPAVVQAYGVVREPPH